MSKTVTFDGAAPIGTINFGIGQPSAIRVEPSQQMRVGAHGFEITLVGDLCDKWKCRVVERERRGPRAGARHVGDAVVHHLVDDIGRVIVGRRLAGFGATALIDRDIDEH